MLTLIALFSGWHVIKISYQQVRPKRSSNGLCSDLLIEFAEEKFRSFRYSEVYLKVCTVLWILGVFLYNETGVNALQHPDTSVVSLIAEVLFLISKINFMSMGIFNYAT